MNFVRNGMTVAEILDEYPQLREEDIQAALAFAEKLAEGEDILELC